MNEESHFRRLENMYRSAPCNAYYAPQIRISRGVAEIVIPIRRQFFHAGGAAHGSVYFKALDDAAYFAVNSLVKEALVLTVSYQVQLLRPISEGEMCAYGKAIYSSRELFFAEALLYDGKDREIARGSGMFSRSKIMLGPEIGYRDE